MAEKRGNHFLALKIGKIATARGIDIGALSHPVGAIPASADISDAGEALAYAIARQESEFNVGAVSHAGARGLLQLLPGTAKEVAKKAGMTYSKDRLTTDAGYNATLGAAFLGEQLGRFDGSYVLTFAGYNAGPGRAREWIKRYGDPRGKDIDTVVDWIERIPFAETRSYVQRVMENYQVYKMRLSGNIRHRGRSGQRAVSSLPSRTRFTVATPAFRSGHCPRALRRRLEVGKRGAVPSLPNLSTWRDLAAAPPAISVPVRSARARYSWP